jgi:cyclophilin family peptidyl-prolyl cis-trans isomerase
VTDGMDAVDSIEQVDTDSQDKPREAVVIERVELPS